MPYEYIFQFCTFLGATTVPLSYLIVWDLTNSIQAAAFSAFFILCGMYILPYFVHLSKARCYIKALIHFRCRNADAKSIHLAGSHTAMLHDVRYMGNGSYGFSSRRIIHVAMVGLVIIHRSFARLHD